MDKSAIISALEQIHKNRVRSLLTHDTIRFMSYGMLSTLAEIEDMPDGIAEQLKPLLEKLSLPGLSHYQRSCLAKDCLYLHPRIIGQENSEAIAHNDDDHHCF